MRAQSDREQIGCLRGLFPESSGLWCANHVGGVVDEDVQSPLLVTDGCEEVRNRRVVGVIDGDGNAPAAGFVDE